MWLHDPSCNPTCVQSFRFELFTVFEIQGSKLNKKKKKKKQKNWENELHICYIFIVSDAIFTIFYVHMYVAHSYHSAATELNSHWKWKFKSDFSNERAWCWKTSSIPIYKVLPYFVIVYTFILCSDISFLWVTYSDIKQNSWDPFVIIPKSLLLN